MGQFRERISIDISGPEFADLYPSAKDLLRRVEAARAFREDAVPWIAAGLHRNIIAGEGRRQAVARIVRAGRPLERQKLKELGLHHSSKIGDDFAQAVSGVSIAGAIERLSQVADVAMSTANKLHNLRRAEAAGIFMFEFAPAGDERDTPLERKLAGKRFSVAQARELVAMHEAEI